MSTAYAIVRGSYKDAEICENRAEVVRAALAHDKHGSFSFAFERRPDGDFDVYVRRPHGNHEKPRFGCVGYIFHEDAAEYLDMRLGGFRVPGFAPGSFEEVELTREGENHFIMQGWGCLAIYTAFGDNIQVETVESLEAYRDELRAEGIPDDDLPEGLLALINELMEAEQE